MNRMRLGIYRSNSIRNIHFNRPLRMFIATEPTPNENALKFKPGVPVVPEGQVYEYQDRGQVKNSLLARQLFGIKGVKSIFFAPTFVTVSKEEDSNWAIMKPEIYSVLMDHFANGKLAVLEEDKNNLTSQSGSSSDISENDSEVVQMIKELLNTRIRPAVQDDGGDIEFVNFEEGILYLKLKGSCRGCSSSEITLKSGIENMMKHYIPEVSRVEQVLDPVDEVAKKEFEKFESKNTKDK